MSKVAIIIPVYNTSEKILKKAFESCIKQSYTNVEIIVVNDGSTSKKTNDTISCYEKKYPLLFQIHKIENIGASLARKYGLNKCSSEFIFFLDADDYIEENAIKKIVKTQIETQADVVVGQFYLLDDNSKVNGTHFQLIDESNSVIKSFLSGKLPITLWPNLYRKSIVESVKFYEYMVGEDMVINAQIFSKEGINVAVIQDKIYNYYRHDASLTHIVSEDKTMQGYNAFLKSIEIVKLNHVNVNIDSELCLYKLNTLYAAIMLNFSKCKELLDNINNSNKFILSQALKQLPNSKKIILYPIVYYPLLLKPIKIILIFLRRFK